MVDSTSSVLGNNEPHSMFTDSASMSPAGPNIYRPTIDTRSSTQSFVLTTTSTVFYAVLGSVHTNDLNDSPGPDIYRPTSSTSTSYQPFGPTATSIIPPDVLESVDTNIPKGSWKVKGDSQSKA